MARPEITRQTQRVGYAFTVGEDEFGERRVYAAFKRSTRGGWRVQGVIDLRSRQGSFPVAKEARFRTLEEAERAVVKAFMA
jgi:hypothetical protein